MAVILAGGSGERFWPMSTPDRPKQLIKLAGANRTLLEDALHRIVGLVPVDDVFVVTGPRVGPAIQDSGLLACDHILVEPEPRNTLGALCWAVAQLRARGYGEESVMAVLTADHAIGDVGLFRETALAAMNLAADTQGLVTIGIEPVRAETGYGYIHRGDSVEGGFKVGRFAEKPDAETASRYFDSGEYLWNSGMFFWSIGAFLRELREHVPEAGAVIDRLAEEPGLFAKLPKIAIDRALMERSDNIFVVPARFAWDDVGAWDSLRRMNEPDGDGNILLGNSAKIDSSGCIVFSDGIPLGVIGVQDLIVVATPNGVLVCHKSEAQRVREILPLLDLGD